MKHLGFTLVFLFYSLIGFGQCPTIAITLTTQAEVDAFSTNYPGCAQTDLGITISGNDITSLIGLSGLTSVGNLEISNCPQLNTLTGLENLTVLESPPSQGGVSLSIINNNQLTSLAALADLSNNEELDIYIINNPLLENFVGLENLVGVVYTFQISNNDLITDFTGMSGIVNTDDFFATDNDNLESFAGLDSFIISGSMIVRNNPSLTTLGFPNLVDPYCGFEFTDNILLTDINFFVPAFTDFCEPNISISGNTSLSNCSISYVCDVLPEAATVLIENNSDSCNSVNQVELACIPDEAPVAICQDLQVFLDIDGLAVIDAAVVGANSTDDNGIVSYSVIPNSFSCANIGVNEVTLTVTDTAGNESTCTAMIDVVDNLGPIIICVGDYELEILEGEMYTIPDFPGNGFVTASDNCLAMVTNITQSPLAGTMVAGGTHTVEIVATDTNGNSTLCSFVITVTEVLGISEINISQQIMLFPNPVSEILSIETKSTLMYNSAKIRTILGAMVFETSSKEIDVSQLTTGVYFVEISTNEGLITKKIVKE